MPVARREIRSHVLWALGGGLLALGLLDLLVADFLDVELLARESRLHPVIRGDYFRSAWNFERWKGIAEDAGDWGSGSLAMFWIGLSAALHTVVRCARSNVVGALESVTAVDPFLARELSGRTWGDVVADGALVGPEPERDVPP